MPPGNCLANSHLPKACMKERNEMLISSCHFLKTLSWLLILYWAKLKAFEAFFNLASVSILMALLSPLALRR